MSSLSREQDRHWHEEELQGSEYQEALEVLQRYEPLFDRFQTWSDFISFMRKGASDDPLKEQALLAILKTHAADRAPRWRAVLLAVFWPGLDSLLNQKMHWDPDADALWQNVQWAFIQTVCKLDVTRRTDCIVKRIINGTIHRLHEECQRTWRHSERETPTDLEPFEETLPGGEEVACDAIDLCLAQDAEVARLRAHADAGRISRADHLLLVGTRVYGMTAAQFARKTGISTDLARKRRLRAEAVIRRAEEEK